MPLSKPIVGVSGRVYHELPVPAGTIVTISTVGYNLCVHPFSVRITGLETGFTSCRNKDLWGPDAHEFRPERWFDMNEKAESPVGVYSNLYVMRFYVHWLYRELRSFDIAPPSPEGTEVALDGDSRASPALTCLNKTITDRDHSVIEIHAFLVTLVRQFDFSLPDNGREVWKLRPGIITPVVVGEEDKGPQLWLKVAALRNE